MLIFMELLIAGIMIGGIYALIALGWTVIFKTSGVLNLATGEMALIGGYVCLALYVAGVPFPLAVAGAVIIGVTLGFATERLVLRRMIGEAHLPIIMVTVGLAYSFRGIIQLIWGAATRVFTPAVFPLTPVTVGPFSVSQVFLWSFILSVVLMGALILFFQRTRMGLAMEATADDEMAAMSVGVSPKRVYGWSWALAFAVVGIGGALLGNINGLNIGVAFLGLLVLPAVLLLLPHFIGGYWLSVVTLIGFMAIAVMGVQVLIGYTGQITLGHAAVVAIGAYVCAVSMFLWEIPYPVALVLGIFGAGFWSVLWGLPAARVKGLYLIVTTMAMQFFTIDIVIGQWVGPLAGRGRAGFIAIDPGMFTIGPWPIFGAIPTYYWTLIMLILAQVFLANLLRTRVGRAWRAIRDNDIAAEALGVNIFKYKLLSFFVAGCLGGLAGGVWLTTLAGVTPEHFTFALSLWLVGAILIGGLGSMYGHIFGAAFLVLVIELLRIILMSAIPVWPAALEYFLYVRYLIYGLAIIGFLLYEPNGLSCRWWQLKNYIHLWPFSY